MKQRAEYYRNLELTVKNWDKVLFLKWKAPSSKWNPNHFQFQYASRITHIIDPQVERTWGEPGKVWRRAITELEALNKNKIKKNPKDKIHPQLNHNSASVHKVKRLLAQFLIEN